jgi:hypothetical protein
MENSRIRTIASMMSTMLVLAGTIALLDIGTAHATVQPPSGSDYRISIA